MRDIGQKLQTFYKNLRKRTGKTKDRLLTIIDRRPMRSFFGLIASILILIIIGNFLRKPAESETQVETAPKPVAIYSIGVAPRIELNAKIEKTGVLKLTAQQGGFVGSINKWEGETVAKGQQMFWLSTNAAGGTLPSVSRQIAQKNYEFVKDNFDTQKELISKRRELAEKADAQGDELRDITDKSLNDTRNLISLNDEILATLDEQITLLEESNTDGENDATILQTKQAKTGVLSALTSLRSGLRSAEYQTSGEQEPAEISNLTKDAALKQLELEEKSLELNKEISKLNLKIAYITESLMYPAAPCSGTIERIYVGLGDSVVPGTPLAALVCDKTSASAIAAVSPAFAHSISRLETTTAEIDGETVELPLRYVTTEPTEGVLNAVIFDIPKTHEDKVTDGSSLIIRVPVGQAASTSIVPYVPLDALYQTQTQSYVYVAQPQDDGTFMVESRTVTLGEVFGSFVEVQDGLEAADQIIVDRTVIEGDRVIIGE